MKLSLLLLLSVVFFSACVNQEVNYDPNNGLKINEFSVDPNVVEIDDSAYFFLDVENVGRTTAQCIRAELFNVESWYDEFGTQFSYSSNDYGLEYDYIDNDNFRICYRGDLIGDVLGAITGETSSTRERVCYSESDDKSSLSGYINGVWGGFMGSDYCTGAGGKNVKYWNELRPTLPERNRPGQAVSDVWILRPPILPEGQEVPYKPTVRVSYAYSSSATIQVPAMSKNEYSRRDNAGTGPTDTEAEIFNSEGTPIQIAIKRATSPIVVNERMTGIETANFLLEFQNVGDGYPLPVGGDIGEGGFIFGTLEVQGPGAYIQDCLGQQGGKFVFIKDPLAKLRSDNTAPFGCTIGIDRGTWIDRPMGTISLVFEVYYIYYVDAEAEVTVLGIDEPAILPGAQIDISGGGNRFVIS